MNIREFREKRCLGQADVAETLKKFYPGIDASLISKVERPMTYGVELIPQAELELADAYKMERIVERAKDGHKLTGRLYCRVSENKKHELLTRFVADGYRDMNQGLNHLINLYLNERN